MIRVHVHGASGYAAAEVITLMRRHPHVGLGVLESSSHAGEPVAMHFPALRTLAREFDEPGSVDAHLREGDTVVLAGRPGFALTIAPKLRSRGASVIDLSEDYRNERAGQAVYGYAERYREQIAQAKLVANPGCYPTATLLATLPLARFTPTSIIVDAKSGITGAGRRPSVKALFAETAGDVRAYGLTGHRHEYEITQQWLAAGITAPLVFTPHVVPIARGMLVNAYVFCGAPVSAESAQEAFSEAYASNPFVRLLDAATSPSVPAVVGTTDAEIAVSVHGNVVRVICAIDNLGRGAAGQAVRNFNIMHGFPEELGLGNHVVAAS